MSELILAIDQGTTGSQAVLFSADTLKLVAHAKVEFPQHFPKPGWVEHDPEEIWKSVSEALRLALEQAEEHIPAARQKIIGIGITNQRETLVGWNKRSGELAGNAIVWQDRRTADACAQLKSDSAIRNHVELTTGLLLDPYFSASKAKWLLQNHVKTAGWAASGELALGTIDSFLMYRLSGNKAHCTDHTNASRTMLYSLAKGDYDEELLKIFGVPREALPAINPSIGMFMKTSGHPILPDGIPVMGCLGDQQAALFGHLCTLPGEGKITFGTGSFLLSPIGEVPVRPKGGLLCSVALSSSNSRTFALEGSVFVAASALQYLRDKWGWFSDSAESEALAQSEPRDPNVIVIPAFTGLGAPYWNPNAKAAILGLSLGTSRAQIVRGMLEAIALQNVALVELMGESSGKRITRLGIDGGASNNKLLMQFQSDVLQATLVRPAHSEITALGAARAALQALGHPGAMVPPEAACSFDPKMTEAEASQICSSWQKAAACINELYS